MRTHHHPPHPIPTEPVLAMLASVPQDLRCLVIRTWAADTFGRIKHRLDAKACFDAKRANQAT